MLRKLGIWMFLFIPGILFAQDKSYAEMVVLTLSDSLMHGRGYVNNGDKLAAGFIKKEFKEAGLKSIGKSWFQEFPMTMNIFPDTMEVSVDDKKLIPGYEFVVFSNSPPVRQTFDLVFVSADSLKNDSLKQVFPDNNLKNKVVVTDANPHDFDNKNPFGSAGIVFTTDEKMWWHVSNGHEVNDFFSLKIQKDKIPAGSKKLTVSIHSHFNKKYITQNVIGYVKGSEQPDSFLVFSAHYDHLGQMGSYTFFPGANDNASGTAMLLDLARYYGKKENRPAFSMVFMAFAGEEAGLLGSGYYVQHPLFPLGKIKFLVNLDMVGSGSEGIKVVNGSIFKSRFQELVDINNSHDLLAKVSKRGEAANSDHYPFYASGVPSFFMYTLGKESPEYHSVFDTQKNVPFTEYDDLFKLLTLFVEKF